MIDIRLTGCACQVAQVIKNLPASVADAGDMGSVPGLGRCPGAESGNPLQYSCLERGQRSLGVTNSQTHGACMHTLSTWILPQAD